MTDEQKIELEALITEREKMMAGNLQSQLGGWTNPMYYEFDFQNIADRIRALKEVDHDRS